MAAETRILTRRVGRYEVRDVGAYERLGGLKGLRRTLSMSPGEVIDEVKRSGLTGRGGAGFSAGAKWGYAAASDTSPKYLICNADEGEMGTHKDRVLLEGDPWAVLEGMLIAAYAIGAREAYTYIRGEYQEVYELWEDVARAAKAAGLLGDRVLDSSFSLELHIAKGRGLYIAGEELALIASLEMRRPMSRLKPPYPAERGLFGKPTVVNNVETLANVPVILAEGADAYRTRGVERDPGTRLFSLSGDVKRPGVYELETGAATLGELIMDLGGGTLGGGRVKAVQPGGGTSGLLAADSLECPLTAEAIREAGSTLGTGGVIVYEEGHSAVRMVGDLLAFYGDESCGRCLPCRIGVKRMSQIAARLQAGEGAAEDLAKLRQIGRACGSATLCGYGQTVAVPVISAMELFPDEFEACVQAAHGADVPARAEGGCG